MAKDHTHYYGQVLGPHVEENNWYIEHWRPTLVMAKDHNHYCGQVRGPHVEENNCYIEHWRPTLLWQRTTTITVGRFEGRMWKKIIGIHNRLNFCNCYAIYITYVQLKKKG